VASETPGSSALATTYGVGELAPPSDVAGAYAERVPCGLTLLIMRLRLYRAGLVRTPEHSDFTSGVRGLLDVRIFPPERREQNLYTVVANALAE
jgi:hypothetical protein